MAQAVRVDPGAGVRKEVGFFGNGRSRMFASISLPAVGVARAGVLICSPLQSEFLTNYRREVLLARALAARGVAVARFHYRGTGHSDGDGRDITFDTMREDASEAATWLLDTARVEDLGFFGTRWGALIAATVAANAESAPLAIWDPAVDGETYFQEVFRFRTMSRLSRGNGDASRDALDEVEQVGYADVFGFAIDRGIFRSASGRRLVEELGWKPRPVMLLQVDRHRHLKNEYTDLVASWDRAGFSVDVRLIQGQEAWWFPGTQFQEAALERSDNMVASTAAWLSNQLLEGEAR
jgi:alpha/beta superfamily hydrolase